MTVAKRPELACYMARWPYRTKAFMGFGFHERDILCTPIMCVMSLGLTADWLHMQELIQSWHRHNARAFGNHPLPFQHDFPWTVWLL